MEEERFNPAIIHQVLSEMAWERMRNYTHQMTADQLLATHLFVMSEILHNQKEYEEFWKRARSAGRVQESQKQA